MKKRSPQVSQQQLPSSKIPITRSVSQRPLRQLNIVEAQVPTSRTTRWRRYLFTSLLNPNTFARKPATPDILLHIYWSQDISSTFACDDARSHSISGRYARQD